MSGLAEEELEQAPWIVWAKRVGIALALLVVGVGVVILGRELSTPMGPKQKQMAKIRIVPDAPPPPPPPKEEKRPDPPKEAKEIKVEQPKEATPQEAEQLKMEGQGSDSGLAGLAAGSVRSEYDGQKIGGDGNRFAWFKGVLQSQIQSALQKNDKLRTSDYRIVVRLWLATDGSVSRSELAGSTGNSDLDDRLRMALSQLPPLTERPPEGLPQPVTMRLTSRS